MSDVRIEDLVAPVLSDDQRAIKDALEARPVRLDPERLLDRARTTTGLTDLGDPTLGDRLTAHLAAVEADTGLSNLGRMVVQSRVTRLLENRLRLHELLRVHPEVHDIEITAPLIVVGLPRSGTTHLVNLLAEDPRRRALPFWESQEPIPVPGEGPGPDGLDPRFSRWQAVHDTEQVMAPLTRLMHDRFPAAIEEEVEVMDLDLCSYTLEWHARVPSWRDYYLDLDQDAHYDYLRTILKALTFLRGPQTWVLKSPQHLEQLGPLTRTFPDATIAFTHRDPVAVIQSAITMLAYGDRMRRHVIEPEQLATYWVDRVERLLRACVRDRELVPEERSLDIVFADFMADELGTVERFYDRAGVDLPAEVRGRFAAYLDNNPRGKHGRVVYDLRGDFGLDPVELRQRFAFYFDHFAIPSEE
ncbi:sulfotransferase [Nocardioides sp.]|uniref:sulfotransferase family protein n=1 Tax=Nocardioides sp. TaxID=35761 RepID=UPI003567CC63